VHISIVCGDQGSDQASLKHHEIKGACLVVRHFQLEKQGALEVETPGSRVSVIGMLRGGATLEALDLDLEVEFVEDIFFTNSWGGPTHSSPLPLPWCMRTITSGVSGL